MAAVPAAAAAKPAEVPLLSEVRALPKVELHAHLSGCISQQKLVELLARRGRGETFTVFDAREDLRNSMAKCFDYFDKVSCVVTDLTVLKECTLHVLDSFAADGCFYLELRTSPKQFKPEAVRDRSGSLTTKMQYMQTIKDAVEEFRSYAVERFGAGMEVGLLLSVDRGKVFSKEGALQQIDDVVALSEAYPDLVVGVDICGNPSKPSVVPHLIPALLERKAVFKRLPITFHTAEIKDDEESEAILRNMRELNIRRLGHVCFLPEACRKKILEGGIHEDGRPVGVELCPTSNLVTRSLTSLQDHHFMKWWKQSDEVLVSINTDDTGLFSCSLSSEVYDLAQAFGLSRDDIIELQRQALQSCFHPDKARLLAAFEASLWTRARL